MNYTLVSENTQTLAKPAYGFGYRGNEDSLALTVQSPKQERPRLLSIMAIANAKVGSFLNVMGYAGEFAMTQTEQANRVFLSEVRLIPGVLVALPYGGETFAEQSIVVVVPALRTPPSKQVFELEGEVLRFFSGARLDVRVIGLKERGVDVSQMATVLPK